MKKIAVYWVYAATLVLGDVSYEDWSRQRKIDKCKGYEAVDVREGKTKLQATLKLLGPCEAYGKDYETLSLEVDYQDGPQTWDSIESLF